jgi:hypothetical protein
MLRCKVCRNFRKLRQGEVRRTSLLGTSANKAGTSALLVFSAQVKETFLEDPYSFRSCNRDAVEAFTEIAQDGPLPL